MSGSAGDAGGHAGRAAERKLHAARYSLPPIRALGDPPWTTRRLRLFAVTDAHGFALAEVWFWWKDGAWYFSRTPYLGPFELRLRFDEAGELVLAAKDRVWQALDAFHPMALPWFCRTCGCNHPEEAWGIRAASGTSEVIQRVCPDDHPRPSGHAAQA